MKWFKHDSNASIDAKLKRVRLKYGMEGYGLYWYCLELIAQTVEIHNLSFELEHDAELIAMDTGINQERVQDMMNDLVKWGLFENQQGIITCLKMASRTDEYTQKIIRTKSGHTPDKIPPNRIEKNRIEKNRNKTKSVKFTDDDSQAADFMWDKINDLNLGDKKPDLDKWADTIRLMRERDDRDMNEILELFQWANKDSFWLANIRSPSSLRKQWAQLTGQRQRNDRTNGANGTHRQDSRASRVSGKLRDYAEKGIAEEMDSGNIPEVSGDILT